MSKHSYSVGRINPDRDARTSPRRSLALTARIFADAAPVLTGSVRNISASGAFVCGSAVSLGPGRRIGIEIGWTEQGAARTLYLSARVMRADQGGMAARFERLDTTTYTELIDLIYGSLP